MPDTLPDDPELRAWKRALAFGYLVALPAAVVLKFELWRVALGWLP